LRLGDTAAARTYARESEASPVDSDYAGVRDLIVHVARARIAVADRETARATNELAQLMDWGPAFVGKSAMPLTAAERYAHADLLAAMGRRAEALKWYATFANVNVFAYAFVA